jgi:catechol 2,3-dioxygenase-like lactoylglutathione lyase family enzyme
MLGSFLEIGIGARDIGATYGELQSLGFAPVTPGDMRGDGYAVVSDGDAYFGLYDGEKESATLTFVRPDLASYVRALRRRGVEIEFATLGDQEFHELAFSDPDGHRIALVEARTFSPILADRSAASTCGKFLEFSLAVRSLAASQAYWLDFGCEVVADGDEPHPWCRVAAAGLAIGLHETAPFEAGPCFAANQLDARIEFLRAKGFSVAQRAPQGTGSQRCATISTGATTPFYLVGDPTSSN